MMKFKEIDSILAKEIMGETLFCEGDCHYILHQVGCHFEHRSFNPTRSVDHAFEVVEAWRSQRLNRNWKFHSPDLREGIDDTDFVVVVYQEGYGCVAYEETLPLAICNALLNNIERGRS